MEDMVKAETINEILGEGVADNFKMPAQQPDSIMIEAKHKRRA